MKKLSLWVLVPCLLLFIFFTFSFFTLFNWLTEVNYRTSIQQIISQISGSYLKLDETIKNVSSDDKFREYCNKDGSAFSTTINKLASLKVPPKFKRSYSKIYEATTLFNECNQNICHGFIGNLTDEAKSYISKGIAQCKEGIDKMIESQTLSKKEIENKSVWEIITTK